MSHASDMVIPPSLAEIEANAQALRGLVLETPVIPVAAPEMRPYLPIGAEVVAKLELFQHTGSFKARGAMTNVRALSDAQKARGIVAVSAGNHALAASWAAREGGTHAKIVMFKGVDPSRIEGCERFGAEVILADDVHGAFREADRIRDEEGRTVVHPFEGPLTALGTATCGLEFARQTPKLDAVVIPIGGGGLIAGMATAFKHKQPHCTVIGVEPVGADSMARSFAAGEPQRLDIVATIADSLGAPMALPYSFALARGAVDRLVTITDDQMRAGMALLFGDLKLACEPAGAAATAAILGPLRDDLAGKRVGVIVCGSNIGIDRFAEHVRGGHTLLDSGGFPARPS